jgi:hypothetical protein
MQTTILSSTWTLLVGNDPNDAYWQAYTNDDSVTVVSLDELDRMYFFIGNDTIQIVVPPLPNSTVSK